VNKPRPRFKDAPSSEEESSGGGGGGEEEGGGDGGVAEGRGGGSRPQQVKKFRKGKPSFLTGRGIVSATRFLNYRFLNLQTTGESIPAPLSRDWVSNYLPIR